MKAKENELLVAELKVINVGIKEFAESLEEQGVKVVHVNWTPAPRTDEEVRKILDELL